MKLNKWNILSLRVIALFTITILISFVSEPMRSFFGDTPNLPDDHGHIWGGGMVDREWNWGWRHYLYIFMCICLFVIESVRLGYWVTANQKEFK
jgi:hypothetical protein